MTMAQWAKTNTQHYENIAAAIRAKNGGTETYTPAQMAEQIAADTARFAKLVADNKITTD